MREESRGAHTRVDFPGEQVEWLDFNVVISKAENGNMQTCRVAREKPDEELERIANLSIESLENEISTEE